MTKYFQKYVAIIFMFSLCLSIVPAVEFIFNPDEYGSEGGQETNDGSGVVSETAKSGGQKKSSMEDSQPAFVSAEKSRQPLNLAMEDTRGLDLAAEMSPKMQHIIIASVCAAVALIGIIIALTCYCKFRQSESSNFASQRHDNGYATYGVTGPVSKGSFHFHEPGDRKLAQSAQMYHYQYQKQQMIDMEKANGEVKADATDEDNEADEEDDVVYQTCGLASSADLQIPNPMFKGEDGSGKGPDDGTDGSSVPNGPPNR